MTIRDRFNPNRYLQVFAGALITASAACSGSGAPINSTPAGDLPTHQTVSRQVLAQRFAGSRIDPAAVPKKLLYVSDISAGAVEIYTYPEMTFAGYIVGFVEPTALCTDRAGNVWVGDYKGFAVYEFAHGATTPLNVLTADLDGPTGCAIDPKSGNLAVTNSAGWVDVFPNAAGTPKHYTLVPGQIPFFDTYDNQGNFFVDGDSPSVSFFLLELTAGSSAFTPIALNQPPPQPGGLQWDGKDLVVGDLFGTLYLTQGANVVNTIALGEQQGMEGFYIAPAHRKILATSSGAVNLYKYPSGSYVKNVTGGLSQPFDVVISQ